MSDRLHNALAQVAGIPAERAAAEAAVEGRARELVAAARMEGASWSDIGAALGITMQGAHLRYAKYVPRGDRRTNFRSATGAGR